MRRTVWVALALAGCSSAARGVGSWSLGVALPAPRFEAYAAVAHGQIHYLGGISGTGTDPALAQVSAEVDVLDPALGSWSLGPSLPEGAARHHLAVAVVDDRIYLLGGFTGILNGTPGEPFVPVAQTWVLDGGAWRRLADQPIARGAATAQALDGKIYVVGGGPDDNVADSDLYVYDPATDQWSARAPMPTPRQHLASCALSGKLLAVGGWSGAGKPTTTAAELYDPAVDRWARLPDLPTARGGLGASALGQTCYVVGGEGWDQPPPDTFHENEGYDLSRGAWLRFSPMPTARHGVGVAALGGALYVVGGGPSQGNSYTGVVEVFRP
jgi:N-acetylneuraminic acid mutarotase